MNVDYYLPILCNSGSLFYHFDILLLHTVVNMYICLEPFITSDIYIEVENKYIPTHYFTIGLYRKV